MNKNKNMLTGKCKEDFYLWFEAFNLNYLDLTILSDFEQYPTSMRIGVYINFFDSLNKGYSKKIYNEILSKISFEKIDVLKARVIAIEKANELYNS